MSKPSTSMTTVPAHGDGAPEAGVALAAGAAATLVRRLRGLGDLLGAYQRRDPAARSKLEILLLYPSVHATLLHRVSHSLWTHHLRFTARLLSQVARHLTGIEIHPGATIGARLVIDHGMGIVIGETAEVGDDVMMYHGVTLGGTARGHGKRHPTVGDGVLLGCGSTVLGPVTIGDGAKVGAGAVVMHDVPAGETAVGVPAHLRGPRR
ncbi:MAG: serine O-acetyltransferase EpsC [Bifidobacterium sp.]|nr:serine O-acetyltransferase EpsC [Bifidobacterium sp.]